MEDRADLAEIATRKAFNELGLVEVVADLAVDDVLELVGAREVVDSDDVGLAACVQALDDVGADKAGGAGDDDGHDRWIR